MSKVPTSSFSILEPYRSHGLSLLHEGFYTSGQFSMYFGRTSPKVVLFIPSLPNNR